MKTAELHQWRVKPAAARDIQRSLSTQISLNDECTAPRKIAAFALNFQNSFALAALVVLSFPELEVLETRMASGQAHFPYISGLRAFRELPLILPLLKKLKHTPDLVMSDGHGTAHPRRFGMACHFGLITGFPTIGCAVKRLWGTYDPEPEMEGQFSDLTDQGQVIGAVLCTRKRVSPVFVSPGHRISLKQSVAAVRQCCTKFRIPEPLRIAGYMVKNR